MATPSRHHCSAVTGAGLPSQAPASTLTAAPILPVPLSFGAVATFGATPFTLTLKLTETAPPELLALTVTSVAASRAEVGMLTAPVAASIVAPAPLTVKLRPAPVKARPAATDPSPSRSSSRSARSAATGAG